MPPGVAQDEFFSAKNKANWVVLERFAVFLGQRLAKR